MSVACRSCGAEELEIILSLGEMPLANAFLAESELARPEERYPLDVAFCPHCALVQITETVAPEKLFREYLYFSSYSDAMVEHARRLARDLVRSRSLGPESLVVEVASNDGYLLQHFAASGVPVLGIEPAVNVARVAEEERGIPTVAEFFGEELGRRLVAEGRRADVTIANNVLAHVANLNGFVSGFSILLKEGGVAVFEVPYVSDLIETTAFDTIYHEHLEYFSLTSLDRLFSRHGMTLADVERVPVHGGSLRLFVSKRGEPSPAVRSMLREEETRGLAGAQYYRDFAREVEGLKASLLDLLSKLRSEGHRLAAYGAAAKGTVLLNYCGIGADLVEFVVDRNPHKQGRWVPGVRIPIHAPERLVEQMPDYTLVLPWNVAEEVLEQQSAYRDRGGKFIVPVPRPRILEPSPGERAWMA